MLNIGSPFTIPEIETAFQSTNQHLTDYFSALTPQQFFAHPPAVWSPAENLQHLVQSVSPVARSLGAPPAVLLKRFGSAESPSRSYETIGADYRSALANGAAAFGAFIPVIDEAAIDLKTAQEKIIADWGEASAQLVGAISLWNETDLDTCQLPHPVLGLMTLREMLIWTIYHNLHHLNDAQRLSGEGAV